MAIQVIWRFYKLPLNDMRDPDAPAIDFRYYCRHPADSDHRLFTLNFNRSPCSNIYLRLSVRLLSSFPSHAVSFFLTDMDCDLHRWS